MRFRVGYRGRGRILRREVLLSDVTSERFLWLQYGEQTGYTELKKW